MWSETKLDEMLTTPGPRLIEDMKRIRGDIIILGAGGKMGPSLCVLAKNAAKAAGVDKRIIAVSRFTDPMVRKLLTEQSVEMISMDLLEPGAVEQLPEVENVIFMAGRKFGTDRQEALTWAMNAWLPSRVAERYKKANITVFSTGNVYPQVSLASGGASELTTPAPVGEYGMSSLARERMFEYGAQKFGTKIAVFRLNYAIDLRYGVLFDIAGSILRGQPVSVTTPCFNCIWQGDANEAAIRCLLHADEQVFRLNVTGPETVSVRETALALGKLLDREPIFSGEESGMGYLNNAGKMFDLFGYPSVTLQKLIRWQAEWILAGGRTLDKPTHFEERKGSY